MMLAKHSLSSWAGANAYLRAPRSRRLGLCRVTQRVVVDNMDAVYDAVQVSTIGADEAKEILRPIQR